MHFEATIPWTFVASLLFFFFINTTSTDQRGQNSSFGISIRDSSGQKILRCYLPNDIKYGFMRSRRDENKPECFLCGCVLSNDVSGVHFVEIIGGDESLQCQLKSQNCVKFWGAPPRICTLLRSKGFKTMSMNFFNYYILNNIYKVTCR